MRFELKFKTYTENLRHAMDTDENRHGRPFQIREVADAIQYSYEHIRKAYKGEAALGAEANEKVCNYLGLPAREMYELAMRERLGRTIGFEKLSAPDPQGESLLEVFYRLDKSGRDTLLGFASNLERASVHA